MGLGLSEFESDISGIGNWDLSAYTPETNPYDNKFFVCLRSNWGDDLASVEDSEQIS